MAIVTRLTWAAAPWPMTGIILLSVVGAILPIVQLVLAKAVIDRVSVDAGLPLPAGALAGAAQTGVWIGLVVLVVALEALQFPITRTLEGLISDRLTGRMAGRLLAATNAWRGLARFEDPSFANDLRFARERAAGVGRDVTRIGADALVTVATTLSVVAVLAALHPLAPVLMIVASLPLVARTWDFGRRTGNLLYWKVPEARLLEFYRNTVLEPGPARDIRLFGMAPWFGRRYQERYEKVHGELDRQRRGLLGGMTLASALAAGAAAAVYLWVVVGIANGDRTLGDLALYGGAATLFQAQLVGIGQQLGMIPYYLSHLPSFGRIIDAGPDLPEPEHPVALPRPLRQGVRVEDVHFTYPGAAEPTLRGVTFDIPAGRSIALVGLNGSGKTTLVKLLTRLYDPTAGRITFDGVDLRDADLDALRRDVAVTFQDYVRYDLTAGENIAVGDLTALGDDARLLAAARLSGAEEVIERLPDGLDTVLGREFGTHDLSEGQWQRLALARTFVRDASILILDEPTAALDARTEAEVYRRFAELTAGRTTVLISHRMSAVRLADRILFLEDGRIAEAGSHVELMARDGRYARLFRIQASHYGVADRDPDDPSPAEALDHTGPGNAPDALLGVASEANR